jgi:hypothetical protein
MNPLFVCPPPTALASVPTQECPVRFDQICRFGFQRMQATPSFTTTTLLAQATWTPLLTETDDTKVILSPLVPGFVIPTGEVLKEGGNDNSTINGVPRLNGLGFVACTGQLQDVEAAVADALRALASESALQPGYTNLWMYMFNRFGQIITDVSSTNCPGIPVYNVCVGDVGTEGLNKSNLHNLSIDLAPGWSKTVKMFTPSFNPLTL